MFSLESRSRHAIDRRSGSRAEIHRHIQHLALQNRDKLALRIGILKVQPAQSATAGNERLSCTKSSPMTGCLVFLEVPGFHEETASIAEDLRLDHEQALQFAGDFTFMLDFLSRSGFAR